MNPLKISVKNNSLNIFWNNGNETIISLQKLRSNCPCAVCAAEKESQSSSYIPIYSGEQLKIADLKLIGKYALGVTWKDGHNTGIFEFNHLLKLG